MNFWNYVKRLAFWLAAYVIGLLIASYAMADARLKPNMVQQIPQNVSMWFYFAYYGVVSSLAAVPLALIFATIDLKGHKSAEALIAILVMVGAGLVIAFTVWITHFDFNNPALRNFMRIIGV